jgi:superfamily II DNA or RNA helicase
MDHDTMQRLDREKLYNVLFSLHGFDILGEASVRQLMVLTLPQDRLRIVATTFGLDTSGKPFDVAMKVASQSWREGAPAPNLFAEEFGVASEFLPRKADREAAVEIVEPYSEPPALFDYQEEMASALSAFLAAHSGQACLLQLPTGAGKTRVTMEGIARYLTKTESTQRDIGVLWMAHSEELCDQAVEAFLRVWVSRGTFDVRLVRFWGTFQPTIDELRASLVVASYQKLANLAERTNADFGRLARSLSVAVVDEAHKALAPTVKGVLDALRRSGVNVIGLTATPGRGQDATVDNRRLADLFDRRLLRPASLGSDPVEALQRRGILARVRRAVIESGLRVSASEGEAESLEDMPSTVLGRLAKNDKRNTLIVNTVKTYVQKYYPTLVFCCTVDHAKELAILAASCGVRSAFLDCLMTRRRRRRVIAAFRNGLVDALFNFGVLSTGFDAPNIRCVVIARPTSSIVLYSQMVGRGLRGAAVGGSEEFELVDVKDNLEAFGGVGDVYNHFERYWDIVTWPLKP